VHPATVNSAQRRAKRHEENGRAEIALRVRAGHQDGLSGRWRRGVATLTPEHLEFAPLVAGLRFLRLRPRPIPIVAIDAKEPRKPGGKEVFRIGPTCRIVIVVTPTGALELAVPEPYKLLWVLRRLQPAE
jgi:hypothetical protein